MGGRSVGTSGTLAELGSITPPHTESEVVTYAQSPFIHGCTWTTLVFNKSRCHLESTCQRLCSHVALRGDAVDLQEEGPNGLMT